MSETTILPANNSDGFLGNGLGSGLVGGLIGGMLFGGGGWGWGNRGVGNAGVDATLLSNQIAHADDSAQAAQMATLQQTGNSNMFLGNLVNQTGDAIVGAIGGVSGQLCGINNNITTQGYENRLQNQQLASQTQMGFCVLGHQISDEGCKGRELQREIAYENMQNQLADAKAKIAALESEKNLTTQMNAQTAYLIAQLKPAATTTSAG